MIKTPEALILSIEKLYMDVTEPLDPYVALALTNLTTKLVETIYLMGYQDGQRMSNSSSTYYCHFGECVTVTF